MKTFAACVALAGLAAASESWGRSYGAPSYGGSSYGGRSYGGSSYGRQTTSYKKPVAKSSYSTPSYGYSARPSRPSYSAKSFKKTSPAQLSRVYPQQRNFTPKAYKTVPGTPPKPTSYRKGYGQSYGHGGYGKVGVSARDQSLVYGAGSYGNGTTGYGKTGYAKASHGKVGYGLDYGKGYGLPGTTTTGHVHKKPKTSYGSKTVPYGGSHSYGAKASYTPAVEKRSYGGWDKFFYMETETFKKTVLTDYANVWVIAFIDPTCSGCRRLAVEWERLTTLESVTTRKIKFGYMDISLDVNKEITEKYTGGRAIDLTPTVLMYGANKMQPVEYLGNYLTDSLNTEVCNFCDREGFGITKNSWEEYDAHINGYDYVEPVPEPEVSVEAAWKKDELIEDEEVDVEAEEDGED